MRTADIWEAPEDSTIGAVASRIVREMHHKPPNLFHYDAESAQRGRENAARTATERALARKKVRA